MQSAAIRPIANMLARNLFTAEHEAFRETVRKFYEKEVFAELVAQEDPDLLDWFMEVSEPPRPEMKDLIVKLKHYIHG